MLTVVLCDDNPAILQAYRQQLLHIKDKYQISMNIQTFQNGSQLLFYLDEGMQSPDIIYLDILMGAENGIDIAKTLRDQGCNSELIFLTANPEYVFDSFEVSPSNYIVKDTLSEERFEEILFKSAIQAEKKSKEVFTCGNATVQKHIPFVDITYFEVINRKTTVHFDHSDFSFYAKLEDVEAMLGHRSFVRTHRSFLVNILYIEEIKKDHIILTDQTILPVGITYAKLVKQQINQYYHVLS